MGDHVFYSLVLAVLRGLSDSVTSVPSLKFAVRTRQRFWGGRMLTVHPAREGKGASGEFDIIPLPYMLGTSCCHLFLCPRRPTFGQEGCCSKQLLPWWSAPAVRAPELKGARRCNSDISSAFPSSISWYAHLTKVSFLSVCVNNYRYSYS